MNTASIVDINDRRELQLSIETKAQGSERMWTLMTTAISHLSMIEESIAEMPEEEIMRLYAELKRLEAEDAEPKEDTPSILTPDASVLAVVEPTKHMPDTPSGFREE